MMKDVYIIGVHATPVGKYMDTGFRELVRTAYVGALNDACLKHRIPMIYGGVMRFQGQVSVFWPGGSSAGERWPCFQCAFPDAPAAADAPSCTEAGVLGVVPGITGMLQACEALKLALETGQPLTGRLLIFDALNMDYREAKLKFRPDCPSCACYSIP